MYDFGKRENRERYGQDTPPIYSIEKITAPVAAYWSENDWMAAPEVGVEVYIRNNIIHSSIKRMEVDCYYYYYYYRT